MALSGRLFHVQFLLSISFVLCIAWLPSTRMMCGLSGIIASKMEALLLSGKLDVRPVLTHVLGWSDFEEAVELQRSGKAGKIVLKRDHS